MAATSATINLTSCSCYVQEGSPSPTCIHQWSHHASWNLPVCSSLMVSALMVLHHPVEKRQVLSLGCDVPWHPGPLLPVAGQQRSCCCCCRGWKEDWKWGSTPIYSGLILIIFFPWPLKHIFGKAAKAIFQELGCRVQDSTSAWPPCIFPPPAENCCSSSEGKRCCVLDQLPRASCLTGSVFAVIVCCLFVVCCKLVMLICYYACII